MTNRAFLSLLFATSLLAPPMAAAQDAATAAPAAPSATSDVLTILTQPVETRVRLKSESGELDGLAPLDVPATFEGPFSVTVGGQGVARARGAIEVPSDGGRVRLLSEPRGPSVELLVRSLNFPGVGNVLTGRFQRGAVLAAATIVGLGGATRSHMLYRDRLGEFGDSAADRARYERLSRNSWARYAAITYGLSALDYWIRPRIDIEETGNRRVVISAPTISRASIVWRSLLVPGAGQEFANHSTRGALWLGATLAAGAGVVLADGMVERDQVRVDWAEAGIDSAGPSERQGRIRDWERKKRDLQSSEDLRRGFRYAVIGAYLVNVVDALFVPTGSPANRAKSNISTSAIILPDGPAFQATLRF